MGKKVLSICLTMAMTLILFAASAQAVEVRRDMYVAWDGQLTDKDFTPEEFAAWTKTTVYASEESPTGYCVTFRFYGPDETRVRLNGEWAYSEWVDSSQYTAGRVHPNDWYNGLVLHSDVNGRMIRPYNDMVLNEETGYWAYTMPLASGTFNYQFLVGGTAEDVINDNSTGTVTSDPQNPPCERELGIETNSQVVVPYDPVKQSLSPDYSIYQFPEPSGAAGKILYELVPSESLGCENAIGIYLPPEYDENRAEPYPYLILAHGSAGYESNWLAGGMVGNITDNMIAQGIVEPMIVISPNMRDAQGEWLVSAVEADGTPTGNAQTYIMDEMIPYLEANYNVTTDPARRACAGLSAGASFTFNMFLSNTEDFGYYYLMSGGNRTPGDYDLSGDKFKVPTIAFGSGVFDGQLFSAINPMQGVFLENGIEFTTKYLPGAHRWDVWRLLYVDLCERVLWK